MIKTVFPCSLSLAVNRDDILFDYLFVIQPRCNSDVARRGLGGLNPHKKLSPKTKLSPQCASTKSSLGFSPHTPKPKVVSIMCTVQHYKSAHYKNDSVI